MTLFSTGLVLLFSWMGSQLRGAELTQEPLPYHLTLKSILGHSSRYMQVPSLRLFKAFLCLSSSSSSFSSSWWDPWLWRRRALRSSACPHLPSWALVWGKAEPLSPSSAGFTFKRELIYVLWWNLYLLKMFCVQASCCLCVCIRTHQEWWEVRKHHL